MAGLTPDGLVIRTQPELEQLIRATIADALPGINLDEGPEQQFISIVAEKVAENWEALQALYGAAFGNGDGMLLDLFSAITGTIRRQATKSRTPIGGATVNLNAGVTLPAGKVAAVTGDPDAQFATVADVTNSSGVAVDVPVVLEALKTGPIGALSGTLTVIVTPFAGWNSITNSADAVKGRLIADDLELTATRITELASRGRDSYLALEANVLKVPGVVSVTAIGNETSAIDGAGRSPKSIECVVWDGGAGAALGTDIAQSIYDNKPGGILAYGTSSANALTKRGAPFAIGFTRAASLRSYVAITVVGCTASAAQIKAALAARGDLYVVGEIASVDELYQAVRNALPTTIGRISALTIGTAPAPVTALVTPTYAQIVRISTGDVAVTGAS